ncbi:putative ATP-binding cassette transporter [Chromohalobacter marismortui]|uniref:Putative ATP-binding cassette transporter n=1 Tax=Chromohalobacter marismortui TaxID=42055 RepID=A0A4R7NRE3_9GAMM|nr:MULTISPECIES: cyclic peptide export ABC transporter [Chromohalobacter]MCI0592377.1 cyclic peptide export ABC transporter [Chromohalobacter sp.]TDU23554.1 putative ATP-binding cassette transporter [Chromohalobacter marismortui]
MLRYLIRRSRWLMLAAMTASIMAGFCGVLLIVQINAALTADADTRTSIAWTFALVAVGLLCSRMASAVLFERLGQTCLAHLRQFIVRRVMAADLRRLEQLGGPRVQSALSEHSTNVAQFFVSLPVILTNSVVVMGCLLYMAWLSWPIFLAAMAVLGLGSLGYHVAHLRAIRHLDGASREQDRLFGYFRSLTEGAKELRLHRGKREAFATDVLGGSIDTVRRLRTRGMSLFVMSNSWGQFLIYAFIGLVMFVLVTDGAGSNRVMTGFALVFVYMMTPLEGLLMNIPRANLAKVSAASIEDITRDMPTAEPATSAPVERFERLTLRGVTHRYYHEQSDDVFELGPLDLEFRPGEITFLVGGNGSGKTTLAKLLVGLYPPEAGEIGRDGERIEACNRDAYRQLFSVVFSDFHLFERLLEAPRAELDAEGNRLLARLHLQHKVRVENGAFTTQALSQGQRKRLALVVACLEDRPFVVFDEWAADQDPVFKEVFYREVLPELKRMGKAVLVISHDDRYFHLADRLLRLESGQLSSTGSLDTADEPASTADTSR